MGGIAPDADGTAVDDTHAQAAAAGTHSAECVGETLDLAGLFAAGIVDMPGSRGRIDTGRAAVGGGQSGEKLSAVEIQPVLRSGIVDIELRIVGVRRVRPISHTACLPRR